MQARAVLAVKPKGNYVMIKGSPTDPNADFLRAGQQEVLDAAIKKGDIKIVGEEYTDGWKPENRAEEHGADPDQEPAARSMRWWPPTTARPAAWWRR